jgi:ribosomal-protein-alanine N-acetyltransferase
MIRRANVSDAVNIATLDAKMFVDSLGLNFIKNDLENNEFAHYFVCEIDDKIIGYINCWVSDITEILNFCVEKEYQKQGIGNLLYNEVLKISTGIISLEVRVSNLNAINFYEKRGFKRVAIRRSYYSNGEDAILMVKE